jgi:hypothetical protein
MERVSRRLLTRSRIRSIGKGILDIARASPSTWVTGSGFDEAPARFGGSLFRARKGLNISLGSGRRRIIVRFWTGLLGRAE